MSIEKWSDIAPSLVKLPITAYKHRKLIQHWWTKLVLAVGRGNTNVVVVGRPSVGKSVLVSNLYGEANDLAWQLPDTSTQVESKAIPLGAWTKVVRVIPGQTSGERYKGIDEAFNQHDHLEGILYVVDWGYTNVRDNIIREVMIKERNIKTIAALRKFNLHNELEDFKLICAKIREAYACGRGPKWLLIVVNKADLFFPKLDQAQAYYHPHLNSPFTRILQETVKVVGEKNLQCAAVPVCSWETDLIWGEKRVKSNIGGTKNRRTLLKNLIQQVAVLSDK